jgi:hypothetical protein
MTRIERRVTKLTSVAGASGRLSVSSFDVVEHGQVRIPAGEGCGGKRSTNTVEDREFQAQVGLQWPRTPESRHDTG